MDDVQDAPQTAGPVGMGGGVPDVGNPAPPQVTPTTGPTNELGAPLQQTQAPITVQVDPAQAAQIQHDSMFGKMAKAILGQQNQYSVGADGQLQNNPVPEKPGQLFRSILGAALLGGAAGANGNPAQGLAGGLARGAGAGIQNAQQQDQAKRQQAEQDFQNQQKVGEQTRQNTLMNATLAEQHSLQVARQHTSDLQDQEYHDRHNAASGAILSTLDAAGGQPSAIVTPDGVKSDFTAPDLAAAYIKNPSILQAPQGFVRHFIDTTDSSNLTFNGTQWVDDSGKPVDMTDKTTVKAVDTPIDSMSKKVAVTGKQVNAAAGTKLVDDDTTQMLSPSEMGSLNNTRMKNDLTKQEGDLKKRQVDLEAQRVGIESRKEKLEEKKETDKGNVNVDGYTPETIADAIKEGKGSLEQLTQGMGTDAAQFRRKVEGAFLTKYPNESLESYKKYAKDAESPSIQNQLTGARDLFGMNGQPGSLDIIEDALRKVPKSEFPALSKLKQDSAYQLGSPEMQEVLALRTDVASALAKYNSGGGNATSDHQIDLYREQLPNVSTPEGLEKILHGVRQISNRRLGAVVGQNPYLDRLTSDINDPLTGKPRTRLGTSPENGQQPQQQGQAPQFSHVSASGKFGYNGTQWVPIPGK